MSKNTSPHILSTASNLLGLCFIVITAIRVQNLEEASFIDEVTGFAILLFMVSTIFSFLSMRIMDEKKSVLMENIAELFFFSGLLMMFVSAMFIVTNIFHI